MVAAVVGGAFYPLFSAHHLISNATVVQAQGLGQMVLYPEQAQLTGKAKQLSPDKDARRLFP